MLETKLIFLSQMILTSSSLPVKINKLKLTVIKHRLKFNRCNKSFTFCFWNCLLTLNSKISDRLVTDVKQRNGYQTRKCCQQYQISPSPVVRHHKYGTKTYVDSSWGALQHDIIDFEKITEQFRFLGRQAKSGSIFISTMNELGPYLSTTVHPTAVD